MGLVGKTCPGCAYCVHSNKNLMKCFPESEDCKKEYDLETSCCCDFFEKRKTSPIIEKTKAYFLVTGFDVANGDDMTLTRRLKR